MLEGRESVIGIATFFLYGIRHYIAPMLAIAAIV
jgi:hypothetical protein